MRSIFPKSVSIDKPIVDWYGCTWVIDWVRVNFCQLLLVTVVADTVVVAAAMVAIVVVVGNLIIDYGCIESNLRQGSRKS